MSKIITKGKVDTYNASTGKLICKWSPPVFIWKGTRALTSGHRKSQCNPTTMVFDVTISSATAAKLVPNFEFDVEYEDSDPGSFKTVTMFAGEVIPPVTATLSAALAAVNAPSSQPPASSRSSLPLP
jgi:hypothetical protein